jgi:O-antigen ligase
MASNHPIGEIREGAPGLRRLAADTLPLLPLLAAVGLTALVLAKYTYSSPPPPMPMILAGGIALTGILALAITQYEIAVGLGFLLMSVVNVEPAPPDVVLSIVIAVALVTGRFVLGRVPVVIVASLGAFLVLNLLSTIEALDTPRAGFFLLITFYLVVFAVWLAGFVSSRRRARIIVLCYLAGALVSVLLGMFALFSKAAPLQSMIFLDTRIQGFFKDPNVFGPFLVPIMLIMLEEVISARLLRLSMPLKLTATALLGLGVLFSYSRAAWLNCVVGIVVVFAIHVVRRGGSARLPVLVGILASVGLISIAVVSATGSSHFLSERTGTQAYDVERFSAQEQGIEIAEEHPAGIGPGQFEDVVHYSAHSTFVRVLTEQGVFGITALVTMILATLLMALRNATLGQSTYGIGSAALLGAWCGLIANSFFVDTLHWRHLWIVAALIWAGAMIPKRALYGVAGDYRTPSSA